MKGQKSVDTLITAPADATWSCYHGLEAAEMVNRFLKYKIGTVEVVEGNGEVGTILKVNFPPGTPGPGGSYMKVRFVIMDDVNHVKETEVIEGGLNALGFDVYRFRFEIIPSDAVTCVVRSTVKYEIDDSKADLADFVKTDKLQLPADIIDKYLYI